MSANRSDNFNINPAAAFISSSTRKPPEDSPRREPIRASHPQVESDDLTPRMRTWDVPQEFKTRRYQAVFYPSRFESLQKYAKKHQISINDAIDFLISTEAHID